MGISPSVVPVLAAVVCIAGSPGAQEPTEQWGCEADQRLFQAANLKNHSGVSVDASLDLDGDFIPDIAYIGGIKADSVSAYIELSGNGTPRTIEISKIPTASFRGGADCQIVMLDDFDDNGEPDIAIGAPRAPAINVPGLPDTCPLDPDYKYYGGQGRVYVFFGE